MEDHKYPEEQKREAWEKLYTHYKDKYPDNYCTCDDYCPRCGKKKRKENLYDGFKESN